MAHIYPYPGNERPDVYEWENRIADPEQRIDAFINTLRPIEGSAVIDIGSGSGFHAVRFAENARHVWAVEPSPSMLTQAHARLAREPHANVSLIATDAENVPLKDNLADIIHSRFAYFFGPESDYVSSCVPGIREAQRMLAPGGIFVVIDNSLTNGEFASILQEFGYASSMNEEERDVFWHDEGFEKKTVASEWRAPNREVLRQVISMEFSADRADAIMERIHGPTLSYYYDLYIYRT